MPVMLAAVAMLTALACSGSSLLLLIARRLLAAAGDFAGSAVRSEEVEGPALTCGRHKARSLEVGALGAPLPLAQPSVESGHIVNRALVVLQLVIGAVDRSAPGPATGGRV